MPRRRRAGTIENGVAQPITDDGPPAEVIAPPSGVTVVANVASGSLPGVDSDELNERVAEWQEWLIANGG